MTEVRPRMTKGELDYLVQALRDREEALKELYARHVRTVVLRATEQNKWSPSGPKWSEAVFHNFDTHGKRALLYFRSGHGGSYNKALDKELRENGHMLDQINVEALVTESLRHRFETLLAGKRKGRLDIHSDIARDILNLARDIPNQKGG